MCYDNSIKKVSSLLVNSLIITDFLVKSDFDQFPSLSRTGTHTHTHSSVTRTHTADTVSQCTHTHTHSTVLQQWCEIQSESERVSQRIEKCEFRNSIQGSSRSSTGGQEVDKGW
jgi:hypothetical protein